MIIVYVHCDEVNSGWKCGGTVVVAREALRGCNPGLSPPSQTCHRALTKVERQIYVLLVPLVESEIAHCIQA